MTVAQVSALDIKAIWKPDDNFRALVQAGRALGAASQSSASGASSAMLQPSQAGMQLLEACAACGHASFITDYVHEICGDANISSTCVDHMTLLDGDHVHQWLTASVASLEKQLHSMCTTGNRLKDETLLSKMHTRLRSYTAVNDAMCAAGLAAKSLPADQLVQLTQLVASLCCLSGQGTTVETGSSRHRDRLDFQEDVSQRRKALQRHKLFAQSTLGALQNLLTSSTAYPFASLGTCLLELFLHGKAAAEGRKSMGHQCAQALLYFLWDCGSDEDCMVRNDVLHHTCFRKAPA